MRSGLDGLFLSVQSDKKSRSKGILYCKRVQYILNINYINMQIENN